MSDVRALLRAERAARAAPKPKRQAAPPSNARKRKATDDEGDIRKRAKSVEHEQVRPEEDNIPDVPQVPEVQEAPPAQEAAEVPPVPAEPEPDAAPRAPLPEVDESEWAAFERDMEELEKPEPEPPSKQALLETIKAGVVASSAPVTAAELEEQKKVERKESRMRREEALQADQDEATERLEDEFAEMDELEERVKRLQERREALRKEMAQHKLEPTPEQKDMVNGTDDDSEDDIDLDELDGWGYPRS